MFKKKKEQISSNDVLQQTVKIIEKVTSFFDTISHIPPEWNRLINSISNYSVVNGAVVSSSVMISPFIGGILACATEATTELEQKYQKAQGIILLLEEQCKDAAKYKGMNYKMIDNKGRSLLNTIINNTSSLTALIFN